MISYGVFSENRSTDLPFANKKDIEILDIFFWLISGRIKGQRVQISTLLLIIVVKQVLLQVYAKFRVDILKTVGEEAI